MANYTDSLGFNKGTAAFPDGSGVSKFSVELDFAAIVAARAAAGATALAAADVIEAIPLPAGAIVVAAGLQVALHAIGVHAAESDGRKIGAMKRHDVDAGVGERVQGGAQRVVASGDRREPLCGVGDELIALAQHAEHDRLAPGNRRTIFR